MAEDWRITAARIDAERTAKMLITEEFFLAPNQIHRMIKKLGLGMRKNPQGAKILRFIQMELKAKDRYAVLLKKASLALDPDPELLAGPRESWLKRKFHPVVMFVDTETLMKMYDEEKREDVAEGIEL